MPPLIFAPFRVFAGEVFSSRALFSLLTISTYNLSAYKSMGYQEVLLYRLGPMILILDN